MQFFSIYDLMMYKAKEKNITNEQLLQYFREKKIRKAQIVDLQQTSYIPDDEKFQKALLEFLNMTSLEVDLAMGRIPSEYRKSYFDNITRIASFLSPQKDNNVNDEIIVPYFENEFGSLFNGDCVRVMKNLPDNSVDLVFADPPFNLGKTYDPGIDDSLTMSEYILWTYTWLDQCIRILKPGGRIFVYNLPKWCMYIAAYLGQKLTFWDWIAVDMKFSLPIQNRLYPAHYALVSFVKGVKATTFNNQRIPLQTCRHCGGEIKDYGGYKGKMNPEGVNVSDVWTDIYPVRHKSSKNRKFNELPVKLLDRIISMSTNQGDVVFDPFGGSGTTYAVAQILGRKWIGCELGDCRVIEKRLLNTDQDRKQLKKIYQEKNCLFTEHVKEMRNKNGFWTCETIKKQEDEKDGQLTLDLLEMKKSK